MASELVPQVKPLISVVVPVFNSKNTLQELVNQVFLALGEQCYELVLVDDGSQDDSWNTIISIAAMNDFVHGIQLMRNSGQHAALVAGIRATSGDVIVTLDDDLQHPPSEIPKLLSALDPEVDLVYGYPDIVNQTNIRKIFSIIVRSVFRKLFGIRNASLYSSFRAFRSSLKVGFDKYLGEQLSIDPILGWTTDRVLFVRVEHHVRKSGSSNYTFRILLKFFTTKVLMYNQAPLRIAFRIGIFSSIVGLSASLYFVANTLISGSEVPGFPLLASMITFFTGIQLGLIGILGRYIGAIHFRTINRPSYVVRAKTKLLTSKTKHRGENLI